ncbi:hypothetical protein SAMN04244548_03559 [Paracoccus pantotrophus]|nr:hypothetical protein SAMN04244548_03559 [Paracoccus pantotrophus]
MATRWGKARQMASRHALPTALLATAGPKARLRRASAVHDPLYSTALALVLGSAMGSPAALAQTVAASGDVLPGIPPPPLAAWNLAWA